MLFSTHEHMSAAIRHHSIKHGKQIKITNNEKTIMKAICREGCKWTINGSSMKSKIIIQVKTYFPKHTCPRSSVYRNISSKWLGKIYVDRIRSNPKITLMAFYDADGRA